VVASDHFLRGVYFPESVYGIKIVDEWRWLEHAAWVLFEDAFLIWACQRSIQEMHAIAERQARLEHTKDHIAQLHQQALEASRVKSSFLANMSHELRTPLNAVIGYSELLQTLAQRKGQTETLSDLNKITQAGKHLLSLINDVLDISKIEAGKMQFLLENLEVGQLIQDVVATVKPLVEKNGNTLAVQSDANLGTIRADLTRLRQCLFNLLSNAGKFTKKGTITLAVGRQNAADGERIVFRIRDTGIGMAPEQLNRLFQPFTQADASTTRKYGGTGLGLAITRNLCQMMGGDVAVQSELGQGTTFTYWLPTTVPEPTHSAPAPALAAVLASPVGDAVFTPQG
jgi:signal transduction histidine kinase